MNFPIQYLLVLSSLSPLCNSHSIRLSVTKEMKSLQYITQIHLPNPSTPINLTLDLGGPFLWLHCASSSSLFNCKIASPSIHCSQGDDVFPENTITRLASKGELVEDVIGVGSMSTNVDNFLFSCAPSILKSGLASGVRGMLGLGRSPLSLPSQLAGKFGFRRKFSLCLSKSTAGLVSFGNPTPIFDQLMYTPLVKSTDYLINVKSVKINGKRLPVETKLAKISTAVPYTTLENSVYTSFIKSYLEAAVSMNMSRVASVSPFELCFESKNISSGGSVPVIDLALQSEMVKWRIKGRNSMVEVNDGVMCLGFLDGGLGQKSSIVLGGFQLEDNLLEFDLGTSMLGFRSSLQSCSKISRESDDQYSIR